MPKNTNAISFPKIGMEQTTRLLMCLLQMQATSGNILFVGALDASKTIESGDIFRINATNLTIELK